MTTPPIPAPPTTITITPTPPHGTFTYKGITYTVTAKNSSGADVPLLCFDSTEKTRVVFSALLEAIDKKKGGFTPAKLTITATEITYGTETIQMTEDLHTETQSALPRQFLPRSTATPTPATAITPFVFTTFRHIWDRIFDDSTVAPAAAAASPAGAGAGAGAPLPPPPAPPIPPPVPIPPAAPTSIEQARKLAAEMEALLRSQSQNVQWNFYVNINKPEILGTDYPHNDDIKPYILSGEWVNAPHKDKILAYFQAFMASITPPIP